MEEMQLALEVLAGWILLGSFTVLMLYSLYLFLELWETDRKNMLILMAVGIGGVVTGIIIAMMVQ